MQNQEKSPEHCWVWPANKQKGSNTEPERCLRGLEQTLGTWEAWVQSLAPYVPPPPPRAHPRVTMELRVTSLSMCAGYVPPKSSNPAQG